MESKRAPFRSKLRYATVTGAILLAACNGDNHPPKPTSTTVETIAPHLQDAQAIALYPSIDQFPVTHQETLHVEDHEVNFVVLGSATPDLQRLKSLAKVLLEVPSLWPTFSVPDLKGKLIEFKPTNSNIKKHTFILIPSSLTPTPGQTSAAITYHPLLHPELQDRTISVIAEHKGVGNTALARVLDDSKRAESTELCQVLLAMEPQFIRADNPAYIQARGYGQETGCNGFTIADGFVTTHYSNEQYTRLLPGLTGTLPASQNTFTYPAVTPELYAKLQAAA